MPFLVPTLDELHDFLVAQLKSLMPGADVARFSFWWKFLRVVAGGTADNHAHITGVKADLLPDTAEREYLDRWGSIVGVTRKAATPSRKDDALRVFGAPGAAVAIGDELTSDGGLRFQVNENAAIPGGAEFVDVDIVAISTGSQTRLDVGQQLTFVAPPAGIADIAEIQIELDEDGEDDESDGAYRLRILNRFSSPPLGGAQNDYVQWALAQPNIASAYAYPNRAGYGTVDLAALHAGSGESRILLAGELADLQTAIDDLRPVAVAGFRVLEVFAEELYVAVRVRSTGEAVYEWDWDDTVAPVVDTWTAGTKTLKFTTARPATMKPGDRIVIDVIPGDGGGTHVIDTLGPGADEIVLEDEPTVAPVAGAIVRAGGPLTEPVRDAIIALIDSLGTANPDDHRYGDWEGNVRASSLYRAINSVPGVIDSEVLSPVPIAEATDPRFSDDNQIGLIIPGTIMVRRMW